MSHDQLLHEEQSCPVTRTRVRVVPDHCSWFGCADLADGSPTVHEDGQMVVAHEVFDGMRDWDVYYFRTCLIILACGHLLMGGIESEQGRRKDSHWSPWQPVRKARTEDGKGKRKKKRMTGFLTRQLN
ncbi:uncharacterized protein [Triticum aestivum]|uniref:uncharacterized protein n=1 Tax=Triticum aestivum TaxID=4565 RepID=UPI001D01E7E4|nr:uncharacterized protein LOC123151605 [Triticum aestivum]